MTRLILMRHAKSDWTGGQPDIERPLNKRGRRSAEALGDWLRQRDVLPDEVLCSVATRTRETLALLGLRDTPSDFRRDLYHADPQTMASALRSASGARVLMLGHNPGIAEFADGLLETPPDHPDFTRYPTCATLIARFEIDDWAQIEMGSGSVEAFTVPRELT